jgi:hypothetical protein
MPNLRILPAFLVLVALTVLAACAPTTTSPPIDDPAAQAVDRLAQETFHRMELGRLATGTYTTNVLVDVDLPQGARVTVEAFEGDDYVLRVDSDAVPGVIWYVSPDGVRRDAAR